MATVKSVTQVHNARMVRDTSGNKVYRNYRVEFTGLDANETDCIGATDPNTSLSVPGYAAGGTSSITYNIEPVGGTPRTETAALVSFEPTQTSPLVYNVQCVFSPQGVTAPNAHGIWGEDFSVRYVESVVDVGKDKDGNAMTASNHEPYKGIKKTVYDKEITVTWKTFTPPTSDIDSIIGSVCSSACSFTINGITVDIGEHCGKLVDGSYSTSNANGSTPYWNVMLKILVRADTWQLEVIDEGTYYLDSDSKHLPPPTGGTVFLDGHGAQLPSGTDPTINDFWLDDWDDFAPLFAGL